MRQQSRNDAFCALIALKGISGQTIAENVGVFRQRITQWKQGKAPSLTIQQWERMASTLGLKIDVSSLTNLFPSK